jgi:DNA polymerase-3 subunit delta'
MQILGHERMINFLERAIGADRLAHAYLFVGPEKVGKTTVAEWLIGAVMASATPPNLPLGRGGNVFEHPDIFVLSRLTDEKTGKMKQQISVEQVRELREKLSLSSFLGGRKVAFIEEADRMNEEAGNALLKTLEEPSRDSILILRASSTKQLLPTIVSRCQALRFTLVPRQTIEAGLSARGVSRSEAEELAHLASGRPGQAFRLLQDSDERAQEEAAAAQLKQLVESPLSKRFAMISTLLPKEDANRAESLSKLLNRWEWRFRDLMLSSCGVSTFAPNTKPAEHWATCIDTLHTVRRDLSSHINPTLALEHLILSF